MNRMPFASKTGLAALAAAIVLTVSPATVISADDVPLDTTFTFNASGLKRDGDKLNGKYDIELQLYDAENRGNRVGEPVVLENTGIKKGKLQGKRIAFGSEAVNGTERWVQISVRPHDESGNFQPVERRRLLHTAAQALALPGFYTIPTGFTPHIIGGSFANGVGRDADFGVTISGGGNEGRPNIGLGSFATIAGGAGNAAGAYGVVGGGLRNEATGNMSCVPGGRDNIAAGDHSFAAGMGAHANHHGSILFNCDFNTEFNSTGEQQFMIKAENGVGVNVIGGSGPFATLDLRTPRGTHDTGLRVVAFEDILLQTWVRQDIRQAAALSISDNGLLVMDNNLGETGYAVLADNGVWSSSSDRRLKKDIEPLDGLLERTLELRPVSFRWKKGGDNARDIGFIAQEVQRIFPSLVHRADKYLTVDYSGLSVAAIGAVQELAEENESMRTEIAELRAMIAELSSRVEAR